MKRIVFCLTLLALLCVTVPVFAQASTITLGWTDNSNNEMGFTVERATAACPATSATWTVIGSPAANVVTYADATVISGTAYCYRVNACNTVDGTAGGTKQYSAYSNSVGKVAPFTPPNAPSNLTAQ